MKYKFLFILLAWNCLLFAQNEKVTSAIDSLLKSQTSTPFNGIIPNWQIVDANSINLIFETAPTTEQYRVVIIG